MLSLLFEVANLFVLPFWGLMIVAPNWKVTRRVMDSYLPFMALALLYLYLVAGSLTPDSIQALSNPKLPDIARFLGTEAGAAAGWVHYLVFDLFVGRWIYLEGRRTGVWTVHSLVLTLFAGPVGLLSHLITAWVSQKFFAPVPAADAPQS